MKALVLIVFFSIICNTWANYCCAPSDNKIKKANSPTVFVDPPQVQISSAGDFVGSSAVDSVESPNVLPYVFGFPLEDPLGLQMTFMLQQTITSFAELGSGLNQVAIYHITGGNNPSGNLTAMLANYLSFVSQSTYLPALSWTTYPIAEPLLATFYIEVDAKGMNQAAYTDSSCVPEFRPVYSYLVPSNPYFSQGILSGREIYISLLTGVGSNVTLQTINVLKQIRNILLSEGQDVTSLIELNVYLANPSDLNAMNIAYLNFFNALLPGGSLMPLRTVFIQTTFIVPGQVGALVGIRALALKQYHSCDNRVILYNVPDVYHESSTLSSSGALINDLQHVYFAGVFGTRFPNNPAEDPNPQNVYYTALQNILIITSRQGANLADLVYLEHGIVILW